MKCCSRSSTSTRTPWESRGRRRCLATRCPPCVPLVSTLCLSNSQGAAPPQNDPRWWAPKGRRQDLENSPTHLLHLASCARNPHGVRLAVTPPIDEVVTVSGATRLSLEHLDVYQMKERLDKSIVYLILTNFVFCILYF